MGASPDGRDLPQWVDFEWREPGYPADLKQTLEEYRALPHKTARVLIRDRIPQSVVDELMEANRKQARGTLPDKDLAVYFIWYESGISFHWVLKRGCCETLRSGGDEIR